MKNNFGILFEWLLQTGFTVHILPFLYFIAKAARNRVLVVDHEILRQHLLFSKNKNPEKYGELCF